jgi:hypothetical protein
MNAVGPVFKTQREAVQLAQEYGKRIEKNYARRGKKEVPPVRPEAPAPEVAVRKGSRASGLSPRQTRTAVDSFTKRGFDADTAAYLSQQLRGPITEAYAAAKAAGKSMPEPSEIKAAIKKGLPGLDDARVDELHDSVWLGAEKTAEKPFVPRTDKEGGGGSLEGRFAKFFEGVLDEDQRVDLAKRVREDLRELNAIATERGTPITPKEHRDLLRKHVDNATADKLVAHLWKTSGGSHESMTRIFVRALFEPQPRRTFELRRPGVEEIDNPRYAEELKGLRRFRPKTKAGFPKAPPPKPGAPKKLVRPVARTTRAQLSNNPIREGFQRFLYEYGVNRAPEYRADMGRLDRMRARYAESKFEFEFKERARLQDYVQSATLPQKGLIDDDPTKPRRLPGPGEWVDTANQVATLLTLYAKPGYVPPNMLGQILFNTIDVAWNPLALARSYKFSEAVRKGGLEPRLAQKLDLALGMGMYESIRPSRGAVKMIDRTSRKVSEFYAKFMDNPFRKASFYNEAYRAGFRTMDDIKRLVDSEPGSPLFEDFLSIAQNANRNIVDYARMNKFEQNIVRRVIFFYPWIKGSTVYTARFASEHPFQFTAAMGAARQGQEQAEEILGATPSYLKGLVPFGGERDVPGMGKLPNVLNPQSLSIFGSAGEALGAARGALFGDVRSGEQLSEYFTPAITAAIAASTRVDPFTGARYEQGASPLSIAATELGETVAPYRAFKKWQTARAVEAGTKDADEMLFPSTPTQEAAAYLTGAWPRTYNLREGQSRAAAEDVSMLGPEKREEFKWKDRIRVANDEVKRLGMKMDKQVADAFKAKAERATEYGMMERSLGRDLSQIDRLQADMQILVRKGIYKEEQARDLLMQYSTYGDNQIQNFRTKLHRAYMGQAVLTAFKARMKAAGANLDLIETDL